MVVACKYMTYPKLVMCRCSKLICLLKCVWKCEFSKVCLVDITVKSKICVELNQKVVYLILFLCDLFKFQENND